MLLQDNWTTFVKARLNCSLPGQFPFYYNELQSTFLLRKQRLVYAVFTTSPSVSAATSTSYYIRQVNGVKLADILFSLLCVCLSVCLCAPVLGLNISKTVRDTDSVTIEHL